MLKIIGAIEIWWQRRMLGQVRPRIGEQQFLLLISVWVGICAGFMAVMLKNFVHFLRDWIVEADVLRDWKFVAPLLGIGLSIGVVRWILRQKMEKGLSRLLLSIVQNRANLPRQSTYSHWLTSALTVGFGGSAGLEAPIVVTGSAIGANIAKGLQLTPRYRNLFLACGAAAGISAVFNSPIAGVIFALEVLLPDLTVAAFIPLMISSATAMILNKVMGGETIFFLTTGGWSIRAVPFHFLVGAVCGLVAVHIIRTTLWVEKFGQKIRNIWAKWLIGGTIVCGLIYIFPPLFGEGYATINALFTGETSKITAWNAVFPQKMTDFQLVGWLFCIILIKVFAASITVAAGGNGGIFAPSLFTGALVGFVFARLVNLLTGYALNETNFVAIGMAGVISGVVHAPMTAMFLIAEVTGGYELMVPLMVSSSVAFSVARYIEPHSVYSKPVAENQQVELKSRDEVLLNRIEIGNLIEKDFVVVPLNASFRAFSQAIAQSRRNIFPIVLPQTESDTGGGRLIGIVTLDDVREKMFDFENYDSMLIRDFVHASPAIVRPDESLKSVMEKFETHQIWNIPVVDAAGNYVGFVSKSKILSQYRAILVEHSVHF